MLWMLRYITILCCLSIMFCAMVFLPLWVAKELWSFAYLTLDGHVPRIGADLTFMIGDTSAFAWAGKPLPAAPGNTAVAIFGGYIVAGLSLLFLFFHVTQTTHSRIKSITGFKSTTLPKDHPWQVELSQLAREVGIRNIRLYVVPTSGVLAMVFKGAFRRPVVVISDGILTKMPDDIIKWILAHEIAHLYYRDSTGSLLWISAYRAMNVLSTGREHVSRSAHTWLSRLPFLRVLAIPLGWLLYAIQSFACIGNTAGKHIFLLVEAFVGRRMELRADKFASQRVSVESGLTLFRMLDGDFEPRMDFYASHPTFAERSSALMTLKVTTNNR